MRVVKPEDRLRKSFDASDPEIRRLFDELVQLRMARREAEAEKHLRLGAFRATVNQKDFKKKFGAMLAEFEQSEYETFRRLVATYRELQRRIRIQLFVSNPLYEAQAKAQALSRVSEASLADPFAGCQLDVGPFRQPLPLFFGGVRLLDPNNPPLFKEILGPPVEVPPDVPGIGLTATTLSLYPSVWVTASGQNKFGWIAASWAFVPPSQTELCGFALAGTMTVDGLLDNKTGSSVRIRMETGITQYRTAKSWDQIDFTSDIPYRQVRTACRDPNNALYTAGYVDDTYGLHSLPLLTAQLDLQFSFDNRPGAYDVIDGDKLFVGYWCEIDVGDQSVIDFSYSDRGTIFMEQPRVAYWRRP